MRTPQKQQLDVEEKEVLRCLLAALEPFHALRLTMPLQYVYAYLLVALNEGKGVNEYGRQAGVSLSTMSRHLLDIGDRDRYMDPGLGLVTQRPDPMELRKHRVTLTTKGIALAHRLVRTLDRRGE